MTNDNLTHEVKGSSDINVKRDDVHKRLFLEADFEVGDLKHKIKAAWDLDKDAPISLEETLDTHKENVFKMVLGFDGSAVAQHYSFGPAIRGAKQLSLLAEGPRGIHYVSGSVDGKPLVPIKIRGNPCLSSPELPSEVLCLKTPTECEVVNIELRSRELNTEFGELAQVMSREISLYLSGPEVVLVSAFGVCFWGNLACELAAKACIGATSGIGIVVCLLLQVACHQAVLESHGLK